MIRQMSEQEWEDFLDREFNPNTLKGQLRLLYNADTLGVVCIQEEQPDIKLLTEKDIERAYKAMSETADAMNFASNIYDYPEALRLGIKDDELRKNQYDYKKFFEELEKHFNITIVNR